MFNNQKELITIINTLSNVENLDKKIITHAVEEALAVGIRKDFPKDSVITVKISEKGESKIYKNWLVVDDNQENFNDNIHVYEDIAQEKFNKDLVIGDTFKEEVLDYSFKRINASIVRQILKKNIKEAQDNILKKELRLQNEQLLQVVVKKYDRNGYIVDYNGNVTGFLPYNNLFNSNEKLKVGTTCLVALDDDNEGFHNFNIVFTRKTKSFIRDLFAREITEVEDEIISIKSISKSVNRKTVIAVATNDSNIDPVGCCIGSRGIRIQSISKQLSGEKIEVVRWHPEPIDMILEVVKLDIDLVVMESDKMIVVLTNECFDRCDIKPLELLLTDITDLKIKLERASVFADQDKIEHKIHAKYLADTMDMDSESADYLVSLGLLSVDDISELSQKEAGELGITNDDFLAIKEVATLAIKNRHEKIQSSKTDLMDMNLLNDYMIDMLLRSNIYNKSSLADLSNLELIDIVPIDQSYANEVILQARECWS